MKMTDEDVLRIAKNAGQLWNKPHAELIRPFAQLCYQQGALDMRERCAKAIRDVPLTDVSLYASTSWNAAALTQHLAEQVVRALTVGET